MTFEPPNSDLEDLRLRAPDGHLFPLKRVATSHCRDRPTGNHAGRSQANGRRHRPHQRPGHRLGDCSSQAGVARPGIVPPGVYYDFGGLYAEQQIAFAGLVAVFFGAVALVFLLLLFLYESFRVAFALLVTTLLALAAVFVGLWLTGTEINIIIDDGHDHDRRHRDGSGDFLSS